MRATRGRRIALAMGPAVISLVLGIFLLDGLRRGEANSLAVGRAHEVIDRAAATASSLQDAVSAQRGFLLTGEDRYLALFERALPQLRRNLALVHALTSHQALQQRRLDTLDVLVAAKLGELRETIALRRTQGLAVATVMVETDRGRRTMDDIRTVLEKVNAAEHEILETRQSEEASHARLLLILLLGGTIATVAVALLANNVLLGFATEEARQTAELETRTALAEREAASAHRARMEGGSILNATGDGILGVDTEGITTFANPAAERMLGFRAAEMVGRSQHDLIHHSHEDGSPYPGTSCPLYSARRTGAVGHVDSEVFWRKDGTPLPVEYDMTPIIDDGVVRGAVVSFRDITVRRRTAAERERLLQDAESARRATEIARLQLQTVFAQSPAAVVVTRGPQHQLELVNPMAARIVGRDDLVGTTFAAAFPELVSQGLVALLDQVYTTAIPYVARESPVTLLSQGGTPALYWFDFVYQPLLGDDGAVTGIMQHAVDVTEQVRARNTVEVALEEQRATQYALEEAHSKLEEQQAELEAINQRLSENAAALELQAEQLQSTVVQLEVRGKEAEAAARRARFAGDVGIAITSGGDLPAMMQACCAAAVTHLDAAFARVWVLDDARQVLVLTASAGLYTHLDGPHGQVPVGQFKIGQIAAERQPHLTNSVVDDPRVSDHAWAAREGMVAFAGYPLLRDDRCTGVIAIFARRVLTDADFAALGTAATAISVVISNARYLESERTARAEAEMANAAKSQFLGTMSHELRTPLNAIGGYAELISMGIHGPVTPAQVEHLSRIRRASQHLQSIINDILNYARLDAGKVQFHLETVDLFAVVSDAEELITPQATQRGLRITRSDCAADAHGNIPQVRADLEKFRQILVNLFSNATKFTPEGGTISISCQIAGTNARVEVTDTGVGIAPDQLERIFEPFVQIDRQLTQTNHQGVGLGLAISRDLARGMGGDLVATSTVGEGSTFVVTIPLVP